MKQASGKTALITGASAGLGRDFARLFAEDGHNLVIIARRRERLEELAAELEKDTGVSVKVIAADLADPHSPKRIYEEVGGAGIEVDYLVNNAGFGSTGPYLELDAQSELNMVSVNISALMHLTRLFVPGMVERGYGRVLNLGSTAGFQAGPFMATYYATKAFVNHFSEALAHELMESGVTVTVSCPGPVATEFGEVSGNGKMKLFKGGGASSQMIARHAYQAMHKGKRMIVHGLKFKFLMQSIRLSPRRMIHGITAGMNRP